MDILHSKQIFSKDYVNAYSDCKKAENWADERIFKRATPPVSFTYDGLCSDLLPWEKIVGKTKELTDYAKSYNPVKRYVTRVDYVCRECGLKIELTYTSYPYYPVVEYEAYLINASDENSKLVKNMRSVNAPVLTDVKNATLHYNQGSIYAANDFEPFTAELSFGNGKSLVSNEGWPTTKYLENFNVFCEEKKEGVIAVLSWQGNWRADFRADGYAITLSSGQYETELEMKPHEVLRFPALVLLYYKAPTYQYGQNVWRRWVLEHNLMRYNGTREYVQNVFICSAFKSVDVDLKTIAAAKKADFSHFESAYIYDAGWYYTDNGRWEHSGTWIPNEKYKDGALRRVSDTAHNAGIKFCMWIEPERAWQDTQITKDLGEKIIYHDNGKYVSREEYEKLPDPKGPWCAIDYGDDESRNYVINMVDGILTENNVDIYRQDHNFCLVPFWTSGDNKDEIKTGLKRKGATENHSCTGYLQFWAELMKRHPDLVMDVCAAGGRRYDLESMRYGFIHTKSDWYDGGNTAESQTFGCSSWFHFSGTGLCRPGDIYDIRTRITRSIGVSFEDDESAEIVKKSLLIWENEGDCLFDDFYRLGKYTLDDDGKFGVQFFSPERKEGMACIYLRSGGSFAPTLEGLNENAMYEIYDEDGICEKKLMSGKELHEGKYTVNYESRYAFLLRYKQI